MLATALTVVLGTAPVTAFAADVDSTVTEAEQTTPQADTTVKEEVAEPEVKAITVDVTTSSTTFDGTQDIVITYTVNGVQDGFEPYQDIPWFDGHPQDVIEENVSDTVYKFTITKAAQQACIERNNATDGQIFVFDSKYSTGSVDFPTVTLTYTTGDNGGDNGNSNTNNQTTAKPTTTSPKTGDATATLPVAGTGHLVFSTLHTVGAAKTIDRIVDMFPSEQQQQVRTQLSTVCEGVVSQQLIKTIDGRKRVAALEVMVANPAIRNLIRENKTYQIQNIIQTGSKQGMQSMDQELVNLYRRGLISRDSVLSRCTDYEFTSRLVGERY